MEEVSAGYFSTQHGAQPDPDFPPQFVNRDDIPFVQLSPGIRFKPVFGKNILFNYVYFDPHTEAPMHQHPEEQVGTVLEGELEFEMRGEKRIIRPGEVWVAPANVLHAARTGDSPCVALDIFSPPRSGFREMLERASGKSVAEP